MSMKQWGAALVLAGVSGMSSAAFNSAVAEQGVSAQLTGLQSSSLVPDFPYQQLSIGTSGLDWDCAAGSCTLAADARLDVLMTAPSPRTVQVEGGWSHFFLEVSAEWPGLTVQDPLGGSWSLLPDLADWHYGVHVAENLRPDDVQFISTKGVLQVPEMFTSAVLSTVFTAQTGWVEVQPNTSAGSILSTPTTPAVAAWPFFGFRTPYISAPVYALPSLDPSCTSASCMRYEHGTLVIDAHRMSFGVQAVAAVPEPATWASMGLGLLALGALARRRRRAH